MPEPSTLLSDWLGRGFATVFGALVAAGTTIFATRKNNEASVLASVNKRIDEQFVRYDAEIERLERQHAECERNLAELHRQIAHHLKATSIPPFTNADIDKGRKTVGEVIARRNRKDKP